MKRRAYLTVVTMISLLAFGACSMEGNAGAEALGNTGMAGSTGEAGSGTGKEGNFTGREENGDTDTTEDSGAAAGQDVSGTGVTGGASSQNLSTSDNAESSSAEILQDDSLPGAYKEILDSAYEVILGKEEDDVTVGGLISIGVREAHIGRTEEETLACVGYVLYDVDGNGVQELIIADTGEGLWDNRILNMYTIREDEPVCVIEGWARNRYYILSDGRIYYEGSGGAAYTVFATYSIGEDGLSLEPIDCYFSDFKDNDAYAAGVTSWFHNTTGEADVKKSEIMELENNDVPWKMQEEFEAQVMSLDLTFFSDYMGPES